MVTNRPGRGKKPFREDLVILTIITIILLLMFATDWEGPEGLADVGDGTDTGPTVPTIIEEDLLSRSDYTSEGRSTPIDIEVPWSNVTQLTLDLQWTDDIGDNDEIELKIELEGDEVDSLSSTTGDISIRLTEVLPGNYTVIVTAVNCPGQIGPFPVDRDNGNDWALEIKAKREVYD